MTRKFSLKLLKTKKKVVATVLASLLTITGMMTVSTIDNLTIKENVGMNSITAYAYSTGNYKVNTSKGINVRSGAGTNYSIVGSSPNGTSFSVSKISGNWGYTSSIQCTNGKHSGWVCLDYCSTYDSGEKYITPLTNGSIYYISPACASNKLIDIAGGSNNDGANALIWTAHKESNQQFIARQQSDGSYIFEACHSGKVLDMNTTNGNITQWYKHGSDNQRWYLYSAGNDYYYVKSKWNQQYALDVYGAQNKDGANIQVWNYDKNDIALKFKFIKKSDLSEYPVTNITAAATAYGIAGNALSALKTINTKYYNNVNNNGTIVLFFEGVGNNSSSAKRMNAMCVVVKNRQIKYIDKNSSTIPDYPFNPAKNGGTPMPTIKSGVYSFTTVNHKSKYAALNVSNAAVVRFKSTSSYYSSTSSGINIHKRSTDNLAPSNQNWVNSAGCLIVGVTPNSTASSSYAKFAQAVGIINNKSSANATYQTRISGTIIVDRNYAKGYMNAIGYSNAAINTIGY